MRLVRAEILKLRRRRGLVAATALLVPAPVVVAYAVMAILHAVDAAAYDAAGGLANFRSATEALNQIGVVAAVLVGATVGAGDRGAGVFRELAVTGRSRFQLFAARVPGGLAFLLPFVASALLLAAVAAFALEPEGEPAAPGAVAASSAWVAASLAVAYLFALGVSSAFGSRGTAIGILLAWQLAAAPILLASGKLDSVLANAALLALQPARVGDPYLLSTATVAVVLLAWTATPLALGAWRTMTADA